MQAAQAQGFVRRSSPLPELMEPRLSPCCAPRPSRDCLACTVPLVKRSVAVTLRVHQLPAVHSLRDVGPNSLRPFGRGYIGLFYVIG